MDNAITRECNCTVCCDTDISGFVDAFFRVQREKYLLDEGMVIDVSAGECLSSFDEEGTGRIIGLLKELPYGVVKMSGSIPGLVQTSLNLGTLDSSEDSVKFGLSVRSSVNGEKQHLLGRIKDVAERYGASAWEYREESPLRDVMTDVYFGLYGFRPEVCAIHAGLECGLFAGCIEGLDCVSVGPNMLCIHTPQEKLSISSTQRIYKLITETLERI